MRTVKGSIRTNKIGSACEFEFEVNDSATDDEIEEMAKDAAFDQVDWWFEVSPSVSKEGA